LYYADVLLQQRDWTAAEQMARDAQSLADAVYGTQRNWKPGFARLLLGEALAGLPGRHVDARANLDEALRRLVEIEGADSARAKRAAAARARLQ
jgi:hypothetical protein